MATAQLELEVIDTTQPKTGEACPQRSNIRWSSAGRIG